MGPGGRAALAERQIPSDHMPMPVPRCAARRRDGAPCGALAASPTAVFCHHHERLAGRHGEDAVREGAYPRNHQPRSRAPLEAQLDSEHTGNGSSGVTPAAVRPALAQAAANEVGTITSVLMDAATNTTRPVWTTPACPECGAQFRQEVHVPDHKARVAAVEVLLREGLGRPGQAEEPTTPRLPATVNGIRSMSWEDMQYFAATLLVDELMTLQRDGGEQLLRRRVAELGGSERRVLRKALAEPA
jgi:hypothetical protein